MISEETKSHFMNLYNMVLADDSVKPEELVQVYEIGRRHGLSEEEFNGILQNPIEFRAPDTIAKKIEYLCDLVMVIRADGLIDENEIATLKRYCKKFGFDEDNIDGIVDFLMDRISKGVPVLEIIKEITE